MIEYLPGAPRLFSVCAAPFIQVAALTVMKLQWVLLVLKERNHLTCSPRPFCTGVRESEEQTTPPPQRVSFDNEVTYSASFYFVFYCVPCGPPPFSSHRPLFALSSPSPPFLFDSPFVGVTALNIAAAILPFTAITDSLFLFQLSHLLRAAARRLRIACLSGALHHTLLLLFFSFGIFIDHHSPFNTLAEVGYLIH